MQQAEWVQKILKKVPAQRHLLFKKRNYVVSQGKKKWSKKQVIEIFNENKIFSLKALAVYNKNNPNRINKKTINKLFGSWMNLKNKLNVEHKNKRFDEQQIISAAARFKILTIEQFKEAHVKQPSIFPRIKYIYKHFNRWSTFKRIVQANMVDDILKRYIELKIKLGRFPSYRECKDNRVEIEVLQQVWKNKQLKKLICWLENYYGK